MTYDIYQSPIGTLYLVEDKGALCGLTLNEPIEAKVLIYRKSPLTKKVSLWLDYYFNQIDKPIDFPIKFLGSSYQQTIYKTLLNIPYGKTTTYGKIAEKLSTSPRAVGGAVGSNQLLIVVPCHRVLSKHNLGGFSGGVDIKDYLLNLEKR